MLTMFLMLTLAPPSGPPPSPKDSTTPTCIAITLPSVQGVDGSAANMAAALRDLFASYLNGPSIKTILLGSRLPSQAAQEARQKDCNHVLLASLTRSRSGGGLLSKALSEAASTAAWHVPVGATAAGAAVRGATAGSAQAIATTAAATKAKDEMRLEYRLASPEEVERAAPRTEKAKAKVDGEDLLAPLVERTAQAIVTALSDR